MDEIEKSRQEEQVGKGSFSYSTHDPLTNLPNRNLLHDRLREAIFIEQREDKPLALLFMDLDRFKEINDTLGHHRGDSLLQQIGPRLRNVLRESDKRSIDLDLVDG